MIQGIQCFNSRIGMYTLLNLLDLNPKVIINKWGRFYAKPNPWWDIFSNLLKTAGLKIQSEQIVHKKKKVLQMTLNVWYL